MSFRFQPPVNNEHPRVPWFMFIITYLAAKELWRMISPQSTILATSFHLETSWNENIPSCFSTFPANEAHWLESLKSKQSIRGSHIPRLCHQLCTSWNTKRTEYRSPPFDFGTHNSNVLHRELAQIPGLHEALDATLYNRAIIVVVVAVPSSGSVPCVYTDDGAVVGCGSYGVSRYLVGPLRVPFKNALLLTGSIHHTQRPSQRNLARRVLHRYDHGASHTSPYPTTLPQQ